MLAILRRYGVRMLPRDKLGIVHRAYKKDSGCAAAEEYY